MDLEVILLCEKCQTEKDQYYIITYMWNLKTEMSECNNTETDHRNREHTSGYQWGEGREEGQDEVED